MISHKNNYLQITKYTQILSISIKAEMKRSEIVSF